MGWKLWSQGNNKISNSKIKMCENSRTLLCSASTFNDFAYVTQKRNFQCKTFCSTLKVSDTSIVKTISHRFWRVYWANIRSKESAVEYIKVVDHFQGCVKSIWCLFQNVLKINSKWCMILIVITAYLLFEITYANHQDNVLILVFLFLGSYRFTWCTWVAKWTRSFWSTR